MAGINGLKALFGSTQIRKVLDEKAEEYDKKALSVLEFTGEKFVNRARLLNTYQDRTGNLRSSIGYLILKDGRIIKRNFVSAKGGSKGVEKGVNFASDIGLQYPTGYVLVGVAGMHYAAYVEARGYDVITGSAPNDGNEFKKLFDAIQF